MSAGEERVGPHPKHCSSSKQDGAATCKFGVGVKETGGSIPMNRMNRKREEAHFKWALPEPEQRRGIRPFLLSRHARDRSLGVQQANAGTCEKLIH